MTTEPSRHRTFETGPYLTMAVFCERVLREADGVMSLIRIIDRLTHTEGGPDAPEQMPPVDSTMSMVINLKAGEARGAVTVTIDEEAPSGIKRPVFSNRMLMEGADRGNNQVLNIHTKFTEEGLYWFAISID